MEFIRRNVNGEKTPSSNSSGGGINNISSSSAVLSTHTIFGQPYDGTNDVKGDLTDANNITANGYISTDREFIIRGVDDEGAYTDQNLEITHGEQVDFKGGNSYHFDKDVYAPTFIGNVNAEEGVINDLTSNNVTINENLTAINAYIQELLSNKISVETLTVTKAAHFFSLIIDEIKSVGGQLIITPANATLDLVKTTSSGNYKCYFRSKVGDHQISNSFAANDQVVCQTFNAAEGISYDVSNTFYWRRVMSRGREIIDGVDYHYILLSNTDCAEGSGIPQAGDMIAQLGNRTAIARQNAIVISAYNSEFLDQGLKAPSLVQYQGINDYSLSTHRYNVISKDLNIFRGDFQVSSGASIIDMIEAQQYDRLLLSKSLAVVGADDVLKLYISGSVLPAKDEEYSVYMNNPDIHFGHTFTIQDNTFSYTNESLMSNYSTQSVKPAYFSIELRQDNTIVESVQIPVIFEPGAVFSVTNNAINAAVQDIQGDIARVELKADNVTSTVANMRIGGVNLLDDTEFLTISDDNDTTWETKNCSVHKSYGYMNQLGVRNISKPSSVNSSGFLNMLQQKLTYKLKPNTEYTFSFYAKGTDGSGIDQGQTYYYKGRVTTYVYPNVGAVTGDNAKDFTLTNQWARYQYTFKTKSDLAVGNTFHLLFRLMTTTEADGITYYSSAYICMPKLEEGNVATAWDSSTGDTRSLITQTATEIKAEVYNELNEATGINISDGSIVLNANKTTINGNLNIRNSDEGLVVFDDNGNPRVMVQNKEIPSIGNLNTSESNYNIISSFSIDKADVSAIEMDSSGVAMGSFNVGDTLSISGSSFLLMQTNNGVTSVLPLNSTTYYTYFYRIINTTTGTSYDSSVGTIRQTGDPMIGGNALSSYTKSITQAGNYVAYLMVILHNAPNPQVDFKGVWYFYNEKQVKEYTLIGVDGIVSARGENKYLYYGDDGFVVSGSWYNGLKVGQNYVDVIIGQDSNYNPLWGNFNSNLRAVSGATPTSMTVITGGTSRGTKNVIRADADFYDDDVIVLKNLSAEVWIKLPTTSYTLNGKTYSSLKGKSIKIKNLTNQRCYVYVQDAGYKIYAPDSTSNDYYYNLGNNASELIFTGSEWLIFRCN